MTSPLFLIGAGFNRDARKDLGDEVIEYPLIQDLLRKCFDLDRVPAGESIESLFQKSISDHKREPIRALTDCILKADHYIAFSLASQAAPDNSYRRFVRHFSESEFISFNYDGLLEAILLSLDRWRPQDGFGPVVMVGEPEPWNEIHKSRIECSKTRVLHVHGSIYVSTVDFMIVPGPIAELKQREEPQFRWSRDANANLFLPYPDAAQDLSSNHDLADRIIAPITNKTIGVKGAFVQQSMKTAMALASNSDHLVAVGYRFNEHDSSTFSPILQVLERSRVRRLTVVSPDAATTTERLRLKHPNLTIVPKSSTFGEWAAADFDL